MSLTVWLVYVEPSFPSLLNYRGGGGGGMEGALEEGKETTLDHASLFDGGFFLPYHK